MNEPINLEKMILDVVLSDNYQPLKPKAIAKKLKLLDEEREIKRTIKRLIKKGRLAYGPKHLVIRGTSKPEARNSGKAKAARKTNEVVGKFRRAAAGFGFVTPNGSTATDRSEDIFIPKTKTADAANLDIVKISVSKGREQRGGGGTNKSLRVTGRVVEIMERHTSRFVGTYGESGPYGFVTVDGGTFESGIMVGDAGAKNCRVGDKVVIEMANFPSERQDGEGVIVEVLGDRGKPGVDTLSIIRQFDLPDEFSEEVLEDAREQAEKFDEKITGTRTDFTTKTVITIDPKTARDFDDAISLEKLENGHWELGVHIADVSHFVPYRSALDNEAYQRATSIYLPDRVIPMLPEIISNNLASLQPNRVRYCMTALIEFTNEGVPIGTELHRGAIKSAHRFTYEEIDEYLEDDQPWKEKLPEEVFGLVRNMHTLAMKLRKRRMDGGAINLILPEVKIDLDDDGKVSGAHTVDNTESHQVIEEFMLAANEAVAQRMCDEKLYYMRRIHPQPSEAKLTQLTEFVHQLGIESESLQSRFEVKRVIEQSENMPERHAIHYAVLRSMQKAIYSPEEIGHYALNSENYCHFTSPIRRYPDLIIHRAIGDLIDGKKPDASFERLSMLGQHCSELEKRASTAERELIKLKLLNFMADKVGQKMQAVITGVESFGVFAQGIEIPAEGLIPVANLPSDNYQYDRASRTLSGFKEGNEYRLGDQIQVKVAVVDPDQRTLEFEIFGVAPSRSNVTKRSRPAGHTQSQSSGRSGNPKESSKLGTGTKAKPGKAKSRPRPESKSGAKSKSESRSKPDSRGNPESRSKPETKSRPKHDPNSWESQRASGPQRGQKKKRRIRDADFDGVPAKKKKSKGKSKKDSTKSKSSASKPKKSKASGGKPKSKSKSSKGGSKGKGSNKKSGKKGAGKK
ncbi:MAG: ribonuclease R [Mariniblastus sp.]